MSFDLLAPHYAWMERLAAGGKLQRCREAFWDELEQRGGCKNVLLVGEGHGRFLEQILLRYPVAKVTYLDASEGMILAAKRRLMKSGIAVDRVEFIQAQMPEVTLAEAVYDLVVTQFFLDCFCGVELQRVVRILARAAKLEALWWVADFQVPRAGWQRWRAGVIIWSMYRFFRLVCGIAAERIEPPGPLLQSAGFVSVSKREFEWGLLYAELFYRGNSE